MPHELGLTALGPVITKLKSEPDRWFIPVVTPDGKLDTVLNEEALWRYVEDQAEANIAHSAIATQTMADLQKWLKTKPELARFGADYVGVTLDQSAGDANERMEGKDVKLALVVDANGKPTHYVTTGDLRTVLMQFR